MYQKKTITMKQLIYERRLKEFNRLMSNPTKSDAVKRRLVSLSRHLSRHESKKWPDMTGAFVRGINCEST